MAGYMFGGFETSTKTNSSSLSAEISWDKNKTRRWNRGKYSCWKITRQSRFREWIDYLKIRLDGVSRNVRKRSIETRPSWFCFPNL